jgi:glyoxylase-like metal-dependent hydrolase (beta-lactamase superfamily II)
MPISRRAFVAGAGAALGSAASRGPYTPVFAAAPAAGRQAPGIYRWTIGSYEVTAINDGVWHFPVEPGFVRNAEPADVQRAMADAFMPSPKALPIPFTALLVNTGSRLILIDTGSAGQITPTAGTLAQNLAAAGVAPEQIDTILISHLHPDHINGLKTKDNERVFAKAEIKVPARDWSFWMDDANLRAATTDRLRFYFLNARRIFRDIAGEVARFEPEQEVVPGVTAIAAHGHSPGHCAFAIASGKEAMLALGDTTNHPGLFVRHPEWQVIFDLDGKQAVETRRRLLDRAAADRMLVHGYHFPFPAAGHITRTPDGYDFVPVQWQPQL